MLDLRTLATDSMGAEMTKDQYLRFWAGLLAKAKTKTTLHRNVVPRGRRWLANAPAGLMFSYVVDNDEGGSNVELYINTGDRKRNVRMFSELEAKKREIESVYGDSLSWLSHEGERVPCRIAADVPGDKLPELSWPKLQDSMIGAMIRLYSALAPHLAKYQDSDRP